MKFVLLLIVFASALIGVLGQTMQTSPGPDVSIIELIVVLLWVPALIVCAIAALIGINKLAFLSEHKGYSAMITVFAGVGVIASSLTLFKKSHQKPDFNSSYAWHDQLSGAGQLNFYLHEMMKEDSDWISYQDESELIDAKLIIERLKQEDLLYLTDQNGLKRKLQINDENLETPWGSKIYFAIDRDGDGYISALGQKTSTHYGVSNPWTYDTNYSYIRASGVLLSLPDETLPDISSSIITLDDNDYERLKATWRQKRNRSR